MNDWSDRELVDAVRQSQVWAFNELFNRYWFQMYQVAFKKLQSEEDAKDIVQEVWLSFWKQISVVEVEDSVAPYLFTALRNKILHFFSRDKVRLAYVANQMHIEVFTHSETQEALDVKELRLVVDEEVERMPARMREIFLLSRKMHLSINEIAEKLDISGQTVKNQLSNALERLRNRLGSYNANIVVALITLVVSY